MHTLKNTMVMVVESLINKFEEDQLRKEETHQEKQHSQSNIQFTDNCSDSDSSFNQVRYNGYNLMAINKFNYSYYLCIVSWLQFLNGFGCISFFLSTVHRMEVKGCKAVRVMFLFCFMVNNV